MDKQQIRLSHKSIRKLVDKVLHKYKIKKKIIVINDDRPLAGGTCIHLSKSTVLIKYPNRLEDYDKLYTKRTIFHELGHAKHKTFINKTKEEYYAEMFALKCFKEMCSNEWDDYLKHLKEQCSGTLLERFFPIHYKVFKNVLRSLDKCT